LPTQRSLQPQPYASEKSKLEKLLEKMPGAQMGKDEDKPEKPETNEDEYSLWGRKAKRWKVREKIKE
jgi:hypothetical protein